MSELTGLQELEIARRLIVNWLDNRATTEQIDRLNELRNDPDNWLSGWVAELARMMDMKSTSDHGGVEVHPHAYRESAHEEFYKRFGNTPYVQELYKRNGDIE